MGDLEPVYDLFTIMGEISPSSRCHVSPTQELMACILRRQSSARKNGTRKKSAVEEDPQKSPQKNKKIKPFE